MVLPSASVQLRSRTIPVGMVKAAAAAPERANDPAGVRDVVACWATVLDVVAAMAGAPASAIATLAAKAPARRRLDNVVLRWVWDGPCPRRWAGGTRANLGAMGTVEAIGRSRVCTSGPHGLSAAPLRA